VGIVARRFINLLSSERSSLDESPVLNKFLLEFILVDFSVKESTIYDLVASVRFQFSFNIFNQEINAGRRMLLQKYYKIVIVHLRKGNSEKFFY
jgi:hypothetical protein